MPSTEAWLPRTCVTSTDTCGCLMKLPFFSPSAMAASTSPTERPPTTTWPSSGYEMTPLSLTRVSNERSAFW